MSLDARRKFLSGIAVSSGLFLKKSFGRIGVAQAKHKGGIVLNLVSKADTDCQRLIVDAIRRRFPQDALLAEEGDLSKLGSHLERGPLWVIDPLDGTVNFLHGFPLFAVSIAFCMDGKPVLGAVYLPVQDEFFWAEEGKGAYLRMGKTAGKGGKKLSVSRAEKLSESLMITGFGYDRAQKADFYLSYYKAFLTVAHDVRRTGSACVDLAWVAAGRSDGFWEWNLNPWDVAAGKLLVEEAGGRVTHFDGSAYSVFQSAQTLATNGRIHSACIERLKTVG